MEENKNEYKITLNKIILHIKTILIHKYWVAKYCFKCGLIWRGIVHDLSKFSITEFIPNVKYVEQGISPVDVQLKLFGYAPGFMHHKGHNDHHFPYWSTGFSEGCYIVRFPLDPAIECICDIIGASRAYNGKNWTPKILLDYWTEKIKYKEAIHPDTRDFIDTVFTGLYDIWNYTETGGVSHLLNVYTCHSYNDIFNHNTLSKVYDDIIRKNKRNMQIKLSDILSDNSSMH